jgi:hypothetical protein
MKGHGHHLDSGEGEEKLIIMRTPPFQACRQINNSHQEARTTAVKNPEGRDKIATTNQKP